MLRRLRGDRELRRAAVFDDPQAAFANLARILGLGGRLVLACWQELVTKDWLMVPATAASAYVPMPDLGEPGRPGPF